MTELTIVPHCHKRAAEPFPNTKSTATQLKTSIRTTLGSEKCITFNIIQCLEGFSNILGKVYFLWIPPCCERGGVFLWPLSRIECQVIVPHGITFSWLADFSRLKAQKMVVLVVVVVVWNGARFRVWCVDGLMSLAVGSWQSWPWLHQPMKVVIMELIHNIALKILGGTGVEDLDPKFQSKFCLSI